MTRTLPGYSNVVTMYPHEAAFTARKITPANYATARTEAPMAVDVPCLVNLDPPPAWAARRRQMRRDGLHVIACVLGFIALIGFAITPDASVVQAQMEDAQ